MDCQLLLRGSLVDGWGYETSLNKKNLKTPSTGYKKIIHQLEVRFGRPKMWGKEDRRRARK